MVFKSSLRANGSRDRQSLNVVPAKAGTIRRGPAFLARWLTAFRSNKYLWLWVPAFAGTTHSMRGFVDSIFNSGILCRHDSAFSPRVSREVLPGTSRLLKFRGRRECRALDAPVASCVKKQTHERSHHRFT